jgi:hypothetical protein
MIVEATVIYVKYELLINYTSRRTGPVVGPKRRISHNARFL